jgi:signal transduction histidine kinase
MEDIATDTNLSLDTRLHGRWLVLARVGWLSLVALCVTVFALSLPISFAQAERVCTGERCSSPHLTLQDILALAHVGLSPAFFAAYLTALSIVFMLVWVVMGGLIFWRKSDEPRALFFAFFLVSFGTIWVSDPRTSLAVVYPAWWAPAALLHFITIACFTVFGYVFPDGRFVPRWTRWLALASIAVNVPTYLFPGSPFDSNTWPGALKGINILVVFGSVIFAQVYRFRWRSTPVQRQQTKWIVLALVTAILIYSSAIFFGPDSSLLSKFVGATLLELALLLIPIAMAIAILRYRLWEVDSLINRTLVYGALTASVVGIYILVVGYLGALFRTSGNVLISLIATGLVAVLFQPLRGWLQRGVNRLLYGQRDEPYAVITRLSQRLEATLAPDAMLFTIVETVAQALKLPYVAILLKREGTFAIAASHGKRVDSPLILPLTYQAEMIGQLHLAPRAPGETMSPADTRLLDELARQAGMAAHAVQLTADLQRSRENLVTAREEERRRLRRDLHDGLGATLAGLHLQVGAIRTLMRQDLTAAETEILDIQTEIRSAISDIRRLVYGLRPPTLDELGLVAAIQDYAAQYRAGSAPNGTAEHTETGLDVIVKAEEDLRALPAAVEVAAYRIIQEALTNVARHARAHTCGVHLSLSDGLQIEVTDDGVGLPKVQRSGVGLLSMRERAAELGGTCVVEPAPGQGTRVLAHLPLSHLMMKE